jgi:hypothetical protein
VTEVEEHFGNSEKGERPPLEASVKELLLKAITG